MSVICWYMGTECTARLATQVEILSEKDKYEHAGTCDI